MMIALRLGYISQLLTARVRPVERYWFNCHFSYFIGSCERLSGDGGPCQTFIAVTAECSRYSLASIDVNTNASNQQSIAFAYLRDSRAVVSKTATVMGS